MWQRTPIKRLFPCLACDREFKLREYIFPLALFGERISVLVCARCAAKESPSFIRTLERKMKAIQRQEPAFTHYRRRKRNGPSDPTQTARIARR